MAELTTATGIAAGWTPIVIFDGGVDGGIEVGKRRKLAPKATRAEAMAAAEEAMLATADAIGFTAERARLATSQAGRLPR